MCRKRKGTESGRLSWSVTCCYMGPLGAIIVIGNMDMIFYDIMHSTFSANDSAVTKYRCFPGKSSWSLPVAIHLDVSHFAIIDTPKGENTRMCRASIECVALLPNVSLTR